jgi:hypothetical protein
MMLLNGHHDVYSMGPHWRHFIHFKVFAVESSIP